MSTTTLDLYHLTPTSNVASILAHGLRGPRIYCVTEDTPELLYDLAANQLLRFDLALVTISERGIDPRRLEPDEASEFIAPYHVVIRQAVIKPEFLSVSGLPLGPLPLKSRYRPAWFDWGYGGIPTGRELIAPAD
jgi:hypothetical protein